MTSPRRSLATTLPALGLALATMLFTSVAQAQPCSSPTEMLFAKLRLRKLGLPAGTERIRLKGWLNIPTSPALDPIAKGARLVITDHTGQVTVDASVPPGAFDLDTRRGWQVNNALTAWRYVDKDGTVDGIKKVTVKQRVPGQVKVIVFGQEGTYPTPALNRVTATVVLDAAAGQCGEAEWSGSNACFFLNQGNKLICR